MPAIAEWEKEFTLTTDIGSLIFNFQDPVDGFYILDKGGCEASVESIRAEKFGIPQADGSYLRKRFTTGYVVKLACEYWVDAQNSACASTSLTSREMNDVLMRHLRSILNGGGRLKWTPTGANTRIIDDLWLLSAPQLVEGDGFTGVQFVLDTRFPYAIDLTQTLTTFAVGGDTHTLTNTGTSPFFPVWKIYAGASPGKYVKITRQAADPADDLSIVFDSTLATPDLTIPAGHYIEIDTFRETVYLDGDGANYKSTIDIEATDFFQLEVGDNLIVTTGDGSDSVLAVDCLWQPAWF
jgi:hypothetical protein